jgi:hypothetical protein
MVPLATFACAALFAGRSLHRNWLPSPASLICHDHLG